MGHIDMNGLLTNAFGINFQGDRRKTTQINEWPIKFKYSPSTNSQRLKAYGNTKKLKHHDCWYINKTYHWYVNMQITLPTLIYVKLWSCLFTWCHQCCSVDNWIIQWKSTCWLLPVQKHNIILSWIMTFSHFNSPHTSS